MLSQRVPSKWHGLPAPPHPGAGSTSAMAPKFWITVVVPLALSSGSSSGSTIPLAAMDSRAVIPAGSSVKVWKPWMLKCSVLPRGTVRVRGKKSL